MLSDTQTIASFSIVHVIDFSPKPNHNIFIDKDFCFHFYFKKSS